MSVGATGANTADADRPGADRPDRDPSAPDRPDPRELSGAALDALVRDLQKRAFEIYEDAALRAETHPVQADAAYARAEAEAAPLIAQARQANDERVRRLRLRARRWRRLAIAVAIPGAAIVAWLALRP